MMGDETRAVLAEQFGQLTDTVTRRFDNIDRALRGINERLGRIDDKLGRASGVHKSTS